MRVLVFLAALWIAGTEPLPEGWQRFAPAAVPFSVALPGAPKENRASQKTPHGMVEIRFYVLARKSGTYAVGCTSYPEAAVLAGQEEGRLDQARDGAVKEVKGRIGSEKKLKVDDCPAREVFITTETGNAIRVRLVAERNRLYKLMAVGDTAFLSSADVGRFLDSFRRRK